MNYKLLPLVALLLACACSKDRDGRFAVQVKLSLPSPSTKVVLGPEEAGTFPLVWQEGDRVSLNGVLSSPMSAGLSGKSHAAFSFAGFSGSAPYRLLYPGSASGEVTLNGKNLPLYAGGNSLDQVFAMHHLCCGVRLRLTGDLPLESLTLSAPGDEPVAGTFTPSFADGSLSEVLAQASVSVVFDTPVLLSGTPQDFYLFFAPGTFSQGLSLQAKNAEGSITREWRFALGRTLERGKLYLLPETAFTSMDWADGCQVQLEEMSEDTISFEL